MHNNFYFQASFISLSEDRILGGRGSRGAGGYERIEKCRWSVEEGSSKAL